MDEFVLDSNDLVSGGEGTATATIDGRVTALFDLKSCEAKVDIDKADVKTLGKRATQKKAKGWSGTGTMTIYFVRSLFGKMVIEYIKNGRLPKFTINIKNQDPASATGKQVVRLAGCMIDGTDLAKLDVENDALEQEVNFTFEDADMLHAFDELN